jgi:hypothetical protein
MATANLLKKKSSRKKTKRLDRRIGLAAVPFEKGYKSVQYYFHQELERKDLSSCIKTYVKKNFSKEDAKYILANPEYKFYMFTYQSATAYWVNSGFDLDAITSEGSLNTNWHAALDKYLNELIPTGKAIHLLKKRQESDESKVPTISIQERLKNKINNTIMDDLFLLEDEWIEGEKTSLDVYNRFKFHGLTGAAVAPVRAVIEGWLLDYEDAIYKRCDQAVEGYSHLSKPELNRRIKECYTMLSDLDKVKASTKATRTAKVKRPKAADKQISRLNFCKESSEAKLTSINPILLVGARRIYTYNVKYKRLIEYVTESTNGFEISGSTLKGMDHDQSRQTTLRKPEIMIPIVQNKSVKQIAKAWSELTTKSSVPAPRINKDTILLKAVRDD